VKTLILGGVRSGKSRLAESFAMKTKLPVTYIATATANDKEMKRRIELHHSRRPDHWQLIEEPIKLADALEACAEENRCVVVDCITLWLTNLLLDKKANELAHQQNILLKALPRLTGKIIFVGNETNMGVIPLGELSRNFCDLSGTFHQSMAAACDRVVLTVAGLPLFLKGENA